MSIHEEVFTGADGVSRLLVIEQDTTVDSPDDWENEDAFLGTGNYNSKRCKLGKQGYGLYVAQNYLPFGEGPYRFGSELQEQLYPERGDEEDLREAWEADHAKGFDVFPVRIMDYGSNGCAIGRCDHEEATNYIWVRQPWKTEIERIAFLDHDPEKLAEAVLEEWRMYLSGEVYDILIYEGTCSHCSEVIESLGGVYGYKDAQEEAKSMMAGFMKEAGNA